MFRPSVASVLLLSFVLGLHGPCTLIDTACSAGLVAVSFARGCLALKECDAACVMGVNLVLSHNGAHTPFAIAGMMSETGKCHTFDKHTDGYCRAESCGAAVFEDKLVPHDSVLLAGTAVACDGKSASLTAPNGYAQRLVMSNALGVSSTSVEMVCTLEAHGTGTALGDPMELGSVAAVLHTARSVVAQQHKHFLRREH